MTDDTNKSDKTLTIKSTLSLKPSIGAGKPNFPPRAAPRGLVVETVGKRRSVETVVERPVAAQTPARTVQPGTRSTLSTTSRPAQTMVLKTLSDEERAARDRVLSVANEQEAIERKKAQAEAARRQEDEARRAAERSEDERRKRDEEDRHRREEDTKRHAEHEARKRFEPQPRQYEAAKVVTRNEGERADDKPMSLDAPRPVREQRSTGVIISRKEQERLAPRPVAAPTQRRDEARPPRREGERPQGDRPQGDRPQGDRPQRTDRPQGERREGPRREGDTRPQGPRTFTDRPPRPQGDRPQGDRPQGDRPPRPYGDRPQGDRPNYAPNRDSRPMNLNAPRTPRLAKPGTVTEYVPPPTDTHSLRLVTKRVGEDEDGLNRRRLGPNAAKAVAPAKPTKTKVSEERNRGRLTVQSAMDDSEKTRSIASFRRRQQKMMGKGQQEQKEKITREVIVPETISIQELANRMSERAVDVIRLLMKQGMMLKINDSIDADTAQLIAEEMGHSVKRVADSDVEDGLFDIADDEASLVPRAPIVTIMGHVDHGKTSLLDALRTTNVVSGEAGGITQHIGAYQVTSPLGGKITFIDTPGHAAFTQMRARGAKVTDIVILVVAADDGVKPQTVEAIKHAKAANVPMIVAINKIDKPEANPDKVRSELLQYEVQVESLGGETLEIEISAKQRLNLDKLLEMIQLQSEVLDLKANPDRPAEGTVIEAKLDKGRGPVPTVLIERGTLKNGDIVVAGSEWGRVRAIVNDKGDIIATANPSLPVEVLGFNGTPEAGDRMAVVESEARAREITGYRQSQKRDKAAAKLSKSNGTLADMFNTLKTQAGKKEFTLVVKGDVQGSVEAIIGTLAKVGNDEVAARVLLSGVGGITESDITLAASTNSVVIGFNVRAHKEAREAAERQGVEIRYYNIIYNLVDDVKAAMSGMLAPTLRETFLGNAEMKEIFNITKVGKVAGCLVVEGRMERGAKVRLVRDKIVIHEGTLSTLKRFKDEVKEVQVGQECGMAFQNYEDIRVGDLIECFTVEEIKRSL